MVFRKSLFFVKYMQVKLFYSLFDIRRQTNNLYANFKKGKQEHILKCFFATKSKTFSKWFRICMIY